MKILVDADACPVKSIIVRIAKKHHLRLLMFFDLAHIYEDGYSEVFILDQGKDSADFALISHLEKEDIVITQDYGVASIALSKKSHVLNQDGLIYSDETIDAMLFQRHLSAKIRRSGFKTKGQKKRQPYQDSAFEDSLTRLIQQQL